MVGSCWSREALTVPRCHECLLYCVAIFSARLHVARGHKFRWSRRLVPPSCFQRWGGVVMRSSPIRRYGHAAHRSSLGLILRSLWDALPIVLVTVVVGCLMVLVVHCWETAFVKPRAVQLQKKRRVKSRRRRVGAVCWSSAGCLYISGLSGSSDAITIEAGTLPATRLGAYI